MKTKEQIKQLLKAKLNVDDVNTAKVIQLKEPILPVSSTALNLISYEKKTDTIWLLGRDEKEPIKVNITNALKYPPVYKALDKLTNDLNLPTELIYLPK